MTAALKLGPTEADLVEGFHHIVIREGYMGGKPSLKERRISVSQILEALSGGMTSKEIFESYNVSPEVVKEILRYAAHITSTKQCG